jgi:ankyrin repeat protein
MAYDAFISYSSKDKPVADAVCASLEAGGIRCWIAPRDILPGREWGAAIIEAIHASRVMVLVFSPHANESPQIEREVERAVNAGIAIVPFRIAEVMPSGSMEYFLSTPHWLDAMTPPMERHLTRLTETIRTLLGLSAPEDPTAERPPAEPKKASQAEPAPTARPSGVPSSPLPTTPVAPAVSPLTARPAVNRWAIGGGLMIGLLIIVGILKARHAPVDTTRPETAAAAPISSLTGQAPTGLPLAAPPTGPTANGARGGSAPTDGNADLLSTAAGRGDAATVKQLLDSGAPVNAQNREGKTALMLAAKIGFGEVVKTLLDHGADLKLKDHDGNTAWNYAAQGGNVDTLRALVDKGADIHSKDSDGYTAFDYLALHGATDALKVVLDAGADINAFNKDGKTGLMEAARIGFTQTANILLQRGANIALKDRDGNTAWTYAAHGGNAEVQRALLDKGADLKAVDSDGIDAWFYAAAHGGTDSLKLLMDHGYPVDARNKDGKTALMEAARIGFTDCAKALIRKGADINAKDKDGNTALSLAVRGSNAEIVGLLKAAGAQ